MTERKFRHQFILNAKSMSVTAAEVLAGNVSELKFDDPEFMLKHDVAAVRYAGEFAKRTGLRAHCNIEPSTLVLGLRHVVKAINPGIVIELVERYEQDGFLPHASDVIEAVRAMRKAGALIAMDDVTPTELERELIQRVRPDIIKVEHRDALTKVSRIASTRHLIAERVETAWHAQLAKLMGVVELQGFWCDDYRRNDETSNEPDMGVMGLC